MPCSRVQPKALIPVSTTSSAADSVMSAMAPSRAVSDEYNPISSASCSAYSAHPSPNPGDQVARDRRDRGAALQRDRPLEVVARDCLVKRERLEIGPGLVHGIVRTEEIDARATAILGRRGPLAHALPPPIGRVWPDPDGRPRPPPQPPGGLPPSPPERA